MDIKPFIMTIYNFAKLVLANIVVLLAGKFFLRYHRTNIFVKGKLKILLKTVDKCIIMEEKSNNLQNTQATIFERRKQL
jgi:hypothetical protein